MTHHGLVLKQVSSRLGILASTSEGKKKEIAKIWGKREELERVGKSWKELERVERS